jgi:hypothetical protein
MSGVAQQSSAVVAKPLDVQWIHGSPSSKHNTDPDLQIHWYDENTVILRQNKAIDYEAPFLFLLFGEQRAVLLDTGATASPDFFPLRRVVDGLIESWLSRNPHSEYALLVLHTTHTATMSLQTNNLPVVPTPCSSRPTRMPRGTSSVSPRTPMRSHPSTSAAVSCRHLRRQAITLPR